MKIGSLCYAPWSSSVHIYVIMDIPNETDIFVFNDIKIKRKVSQILKPLIEHKLNEDR